MASKRRIRRKQCGRKVRHISFDLAIAAIKKWRAFGELHAYKCGFCGGWHVGHMPANVRKKINTKYD